MITFPNNWYTIGQKPDINTIEHTLITVLKSLNCNNLALSGGVDSSYMLYCMSKVFGNNINCYTIALNEEHPDYIHSNNITKVFGVKWFYLLTEKRIEDKEDDFPGDGGVKSFFKWISSLEVPSIICCDGIDEFMGGYYKHMKEPVHETYYDFMLRLQKEQLQPLDKNSEGINVLLPYLDNRLITLYNNFPMVDRFDFNDRKKLMILLAKDKIPYNILYRRKYGFVDVGVIK